MRELWIKIDPLLTKNEKILMIKDTLNYCNAYIVDQIDVELARDVGATNIVSPDDGDILLINTTDEVHTAKEQRKPTCIIVMIKSKEDEEEIINAAACSIDYIAVICTDWKIIPLENLIANIHGKSRLLAWVTNVQEARTALEALEIGVDGVVADLRNPYEVKMIDTEIHKVKTREKERDAVEHLPLSSAKILETRPIGIGARVCVDTCDLMMKGEGMLVGCQSSGLFLIEGEVHEAPYVNPRPFRVNAGPLAHYILTPGGKTRYLSELVAGDEVLIVNRNGGNRVTNICRVKIEWRPLMLIIANYEGKRMKAIVQNAETIRVINREGQKSITELESGDEVLVFIEEGGRHFGTLVKEERVIER